MQLKLDEVFTKRPPAPPPERKYVGLDLDTIAQLDDIGATHNVGTRFEVIKQLVNHAHESLVRQKRRRR